jgi:hypothetical protein
MSFFVGKSQFFSIDQCRHWYLAVGQRGANEHPGGSSFCHAVYFCLRRILSTRQHASKFPAADALFGQNKRCFAIVKARSSPTLNRGAIWVVSAGGLRPRSPETLFAKASVPRRVNSCSRGAVHNNRVTQSAIDTYPVSRSAQQSASWLFNDKELKSKGHPRGGGGTRQSFVTNETMRA